MKLKMFFERMKDSHALYWVVLLLVLAAFFTQAFIYAHSLPSQLDEGSFLVKGYLFISGRYKPFEDYGPWTNNMPLAYLIPGIPQVLFGPSLLVGRYFAIAAAFLTLTGLWVVINRLTGRWWALFSVASLALSPGWVAVNVKAVSQVLVACQVSWFFVLLLGDDRKDWHIVGAALVSASLTLTRQNMIFMMAFVVLYTWWQFGFKKALLALPFAAIPFLAVHIIYYPKIMNLWYPWIPGSIKGLLNFGYMNIGGHQVWRPDGDLIDRVSSFFITMRYYFIPILGNFLTLPLLSKSSNWRTKSGHRLVISLFLLFSLLFGMHAWASLTKNYCIFCFSNYVDFFLPAAVVMSALTFSAIFNRQSKIPAFFLALLITIIVPGVFFGSVDTVGRAILALPVPRVRAGGFAGGFTQLWELFRNRFAWTYDQVLLIVPPVFGLISLALFKIITLIFYRIRQNKNGYANFFLVVFIFAALLLTPTNLLGGYADENTCNGDVLRAYEIAGAELNARIPPESEIFWGSGSVVTPLLYIADKHIQPLQLNGIYPKRIGGERDALEKDGYFNADSVRAWRNSADYLLVQTANMREFWDDYLDPGAFDELSPTVPIDPCDPQSAIKIFRRK